MTSLTLGCLYHPGHLSRAVCCRYEGLTLPPPYRVNHPLLGCVPGQEAEREIGKTNESSLNWCAGDERVEVVDGCRGRAGNEVSRIARVELWKELEEVTGAKVREKRSVVGYGEVRGRFNLFVKEKGMGLWIKKPE